MILTSDFESQGHSHRLTMLVCTTIGDIMISTVDYVGAQVILLNIPAECHLPIKCQTSLYCGKWKNTDVVILTLAGIVPNVGTVQNMLICYVVSEVHDPWPQLSRVVM